MYVSTAWSMVKAYDAATGKLLWSYDPQVPREVGVKACCDVVNRGVAAWKGKIYVGTFDGRLVALDARDRQAGVERRHRSTRARPTPSPGARASSKGTVIIGKSGGEYGMRGYISAYDADTGKLAWRFYTVPGDPVQAVREQGDGDGREDLERRVVEARRRRHGLGRHRLRSGAQSGLLRHRQRHRHGRRTTAARTRATICSSPRSSRSTPIPASTSGTTRRRPARSGTSTPSSS